MKLKDAIKIAENVSVDYSGMTQEEIDQMDEALTMIQDCEFCKHKDNCDFKDDGNDFCFPFMRFNLTGIWETKKMTKEDSDHE